MLSYYGDGSTNEAISHRPYRAVTSHRLGDRQWEIAKARDKQTSLRLQIVSKDTVSINIYKVSASQIATI